MFSVKLNDFSPKQIVQRVISTQLMPQYWVSNVVSFKPLKLYKHTSSFGAMNLGSWARSGA